MKAVIERIAVRLSRLEALARHGRMSHGELLSLDAETNKLLERFASPPIKDSGQELTAILDRSNGL
jgi:hypothetical protein